MAKMNIRRIVLEQVTEKKGLLGKKSEEEYVCLYVDGGTVRLRRSAVTESGQSWAQFKRKLRTTAETKRIPFQDQR